MAGVAPSRGGSNATTIGMVVAIIVAVLLGGVLIWLFTLQEQLRADTEQAVQARARLASRADETAAKSRFPDASSSRKTLVGEMNKGVQLLLSRLSGNQNQTPQNAIDQLDTVLEEIVTRNEVPDPGEMSSAYGASTLIKNLHDLYVAEKEARIEAEKELESVRDNLKDAIATNKKLKSKFDTRLEKAQGNLAAAQAAKNDLEEIKSNELRALSQKVESSRLELIEARKTHAQTRRKFRKAASDLNALLEEQAQALGDRRGPAPANAQSLATARTPVGRILHAIPGNALVHINLGREENASLGMTFSVYSSDERIPANGRGKASLEVVNVGQRTSECRVVSPPSPDNPILEGDSVGNIILSRDRVKQRVFCIVGDFDTDFDGQPDVRGRENIASLIRRSGGRVVDRVDAMTDFLVVGMEPPGMDVLSTRASGEEVEEDMAEDEGDEDASIDEDDEDEEYEDSFDEDDESEDEEDEDSFDEDEESEDEDEDSLDEDDESEDEDEDSLDEDDESEDEDEDSLDEDDESEDEDEDSLDEDDDSEDEDEDSLDEDDEDDDEDEDDEDDDLRPGDGGPGSLPTPHIERKTAIDPTISVQQRRYRNEAERYRDALRRAKAFHVPLLTQEQFFNFIGIEGTRSDIRRLQG
ncbi:MAG: hypothetical protein ACE5EQ_07030 [Phycisphaerae bacterium]